jgi:hypothetical protein
LSKEHRAWPEAFRDDRGHQLGRLRFRQTAVARQSQANARAEVLGAGRRQVVVGLGQRAGVPDPSLSSPRLAPGSPAFSAYIDEQRAALAPNSPQRRHPHRAKAHGIPPAAGPPLRARRRLAIALGAGDTFASIVAS